MFTGLIEEIGIIKSFEQKERYANITVQCSKILDDIKIGDSIAINGCCQTVVSFNSNSFSTNVSDETLKITNFSNYTIGQEVNLERAILPTTRFGGHVVQGHIDGCGKFLKLTKYDMFYDLEFEVPATLVSYIVKKGSIAINGISLTVADINGRIIKIAVIPHTYQNTILKTLKIGEKVNIETDILSRYVEKFLSQNNNKSNIDENFLKENGFM